MINLVPPRATAQPSHNSKPSADLQISTQEDEWQKKKRKQRQADKDEFREPGYLPGYQREFGLGLTPFAPRAGSLTGGLTAPTFAPTPTQGWRFNFSGFMNVAMRLSIGHRNDEAAEQTSQTTIHSPPMVAESYGSFHSTNAIPSNWVELKFGYASRYASANVIIDTWNPSRAVSWNQIGSQNFVDQAFIALKTPDLNGLNLTVLVGSLTSRYGALGQYDVGRYGAALIGEVVGTGGKLIADYRLSGPWGVLFEHGISGRFERAPYGVLAGLQSARSNPAYPSSWVHHAHAGFYKLGEIQVQGGLHYLTHWSQDDRGNFAVDDPDTPAINERDPRDARLSVLGADLRIWSRPIGHLAVAAAYSQGHDIFQLNGLTLFGARTGEAIARRFIGQYGGSTGSMLVTGFEYSVSLANLLRDTQSLQQGHSDLIVAVMANYAAIRSADPVFNNKSMIKFGTEATYRFFPWVAGSLRYDYVAPNSMDAQETFHVVAPKLIFKSSWASREQVILHYVKWWLGERTFAPFPDDLTRGRLDSQLLGLSFSMWW